MKINEEAYIIKYEQQFCSLIKRLDTMWHSRWKIPHIPYT